MPSRHPASKSPSDAFRPAPLSTAERQAAARLSSLLLRQGGGRTRLTVSSESGESVELLPSLANVLETAAGLVAGGSGVAVLARDEELTSQQAADLLNVSRQYMVRLLERGDIASTKVGTHRRVRAKDLAIYRQRRNERRNAALADITDQAQRSGGYDTAATFGPRRRS